MSIGSLRWQNLALNHSAAIRGSSSKFIFIYQHACVEVWNVLQYTVHVSGVMGGWGRGGGGEWVRVWDRSLIHIIATPRSLGYI